jgi:NitT/TauT family transport system substrate-binding protein
VRRPFLALLTAVPLVLTACGGGGEDTAESTGSGGADGATETTQVTVGVIPIVDVAPIYLGDEQGFFEERGIELELVQAQGGAAIVPAVLSGEYQFGFSNVTSLLLAKSRNLPLKVVAAGNSTTGDPKDDIGALLVPADSPIQTPADLDGKTVAINTAKNISDTVVRESARKAGGDPASITFTELGFPDMPAAIAAERVDAAFVLEPFKSVALQAGAREISAPYADTAEDLLIAAYFTSEQTLAEDPELVERFTEAMNESLEYAAANEEEARQVLTTYTKIDPALIPELTLPTWSTDIDASRMERLADLALEDGLVTEAVPVDDLLP